MSESIHHDCGIALLRLRKPLSFYLSKYGPTYGLNKMFILMEKQRNRGQDGAGIANIKLNQPSGYRYISRLRSMKSMPLENIFNKIEKKYNRAQKIGKENYYDEFWLKKNLAFCGELWLGHLRYGTHGLNNIESVHPFLRQNNWRSRNLVMAGNFNLTNVNDLFDILVNLGQHPKEKVDTVTVMEKIGHFLDQEVEFQFNKHKGKFSNKEISEIIENEIELGRILIKACRDFDGGYAMAGLIGSGSAFVVRDPNGIRPAYFYANDEIVVVASEKPAIKTAFNIDYNQIEEVKPGHALIITKNGEFSQQAILPIKEKKSCSFERIYFSQGNDPEIYKERKDLGKLLSPLILDAINFDLKNTIFSFVPNSAEISFYGLLTEIKNFLIQKQKEVIIDKKPSVDSVEDILSITLRIEKLIWKDAKLRTFITEESHRNFLMSHVYDTAYEVVNKGKDTIIVVDDSIVRGTTLSKSILTLLDSLEPKKIVVVSSAPQIRFPDCYGIDMSKMGEFVAFQAVVKLLKERDKVYILDEVYNLCLDAIKHRQNVNHVKKLYELFEYGEISNKITEIIRPKGMKSELKVVYQTIGALQKAIPNHKGDWYFTGNYPTLGGMLVVNQAFVNYMEGKSVRAYC